MCRLKGPYTVIETARMMFVVTTRKSCSLIRKRIRCMYVSHATSYTRSRQPIDTRILYAFTLLLISLTNRLLQSAWTGLRLARRHVIARGRSGIVLAMFVIFIIQARITRQRYFQCAIINILYDSLLLYWRGEACTLQSWFLFTCRVYSPMIPRKAPTNVS